MTEHVEEIEISPAMIEAGTDILFLYEPGDDGEWLALAMYSAMERVRRHEMRTLPTNSYECLFFSLPPT